MIDFNTFISLLITIIIFYISTYISLKVKKYELKTKLVQENKEELLIRINKELEFNELFIIITHFTTLVLIIFILFLCYSPTINWSTIPNLLINFIKKPFIFNENFFSNPKFRFSYITETVFLIFFILHNIIQDIIDDKEMDYDVRIICEEEIIIPLLLILTLVFMNFYLSTFISRYLTFCYNFLSIIINYIIYSKINVICYYFKKYFY